MALDADIIAANALALEKIKAQEYRNSLAAQIADRAALRALAQGFLTWLQDEYAKIPIEPDLRTQITMAIADKYMTTSTATTPETVLLDAVNDSRRLKAAVDEVLKTLA